MVNKKNRTENITARVIADSINERGERITSFVLTFPRIVLAEFNTHRVFSRNSASSRAIPFDRMVSLVKAQPFIPIKWQKDHSGMQGSEYLKGRDIELADNTWLRARDNAVREATMLNKNIQVTKQLANRLLEPFMYHTVILTATDFENFFALRAHPQAEIHIALLAERMLEAYNKSFPTLLKEGDWHIPFGDNMGSLEQYAEFENVSEEDLQELKLKVAVARCARVSYLNFDGTDDFTKDVKLYERLSQSGHWSPFEHVARVMTNDERLMLDGKSGNFEGYIQLRKTFPNENKSDPRVVKK